MRKEEGKESTLEDKWDAYLVQKGIRKLEGKKEYVLNIRKLERDAAKKQKIKMLALRKRREGAWM